jgi:PQQ-dependent dehydrogenase (s-GDH family)
MKKSPLLLFIAIGLSFSSFSQANFDAGPLNEVFRQTILRGAATRLWDPWEITYGPDDSLWITEAKAYKVDKVSPVNGGMRTVLDISQGSAFTPAIFRMQFNIGTNNPQGGLMGLAIHPEFMTNPAKKFVYIAYVYSFTTALTDSQGVFYVNRIVRFTYNGSQLVSPVSLCDTLPGSSDHNSGRMIIAPVGGVDYLFYAQGDMGAGQFGNQYRMEKAQMPGSYEGKILRFNLEPDGDAGTLDQWIPNDNPYNGTLGVQSAVWALGIRNNQGFAYGIINGTPRLYGASHGPFTDDEINILDSAKNYGHPLVIGFADNNYNNSRAGLAPRVSPAPPNNNKLPLIVNEAGNATTIGPKYRDPIFTFYPAAQATVNNIYTTNPSNLTWPSEAPSGIDLYTQSVVPGWKNSLLLGSLKGGRILRLNLNADGSGTAPTGTVSDTNTLFRSVNRFRDVAISPDGRSIFTVIDSSSTTSGPTTANPIVSACRGCVQKYTFLGYNTSGTFPTGTFTTTMPSSISIAAGTANQCETGNIVVINAANNNTNIWVPITDTNSNIIAEIYANGQNLDTVRTSFYRNAGPIRADGGNRYYADRNITITPQTQPGANVAIRLYITNAEFNSLNSAPSSGIGGLIANVGIFKNSNNVCGPVLSGGPASAVTTITKAAFGASGYVLQSNVLPSFSTFYFANASFTTLPVQMISFTGNLSNNATLLNWTTGTEVNTANFEIERSIDGNSYNKIGTVTASGNSSVPLDYSYTDNDVITLSASVIYYRLKIMDRDGHYDYSNLVTVSLADIAGRVTIFPNPAAENANVTIGAISDGNVQCKILDNAGRTVLQNAAGLKKGRNNIVINIHKLSTGIYYLSVTGAGIDKKVKLQKL